MTNKIGRSICSLLHLRVRYPASILGPLVLIVTLACSPAPDPAAAFEASLLTSTQVTVKVTYETVMTTDPSDTFHAVTTISQRPPDRRVDALIDGETESFVLLEGELIECKEGVCRAVNNGSGTSVQNRLSSVDVFLDSRGFFLDLLAEEPDLEVEFRPNRVIAGLSAECFGDTSTESQISGSVEACFSSKDGMLLFADFQITWPSNIRTSMSISAISVDLTVSDEDLAPPFPVEEGSS